MSTTLGLELAAARTLEPRTKRAGKFRNVRTAVDGISFASKKEARRYRQLKTLESAGRIAKLELQPKFDLIVNGQKVCAYVGDFRYIEDGETVVEDVKGYRDRVYILKRALMRIVLGIEIRET